MNIKHTLSIIILFTAMLWPAHAGAQGWQWAAGGRGSNGEAMGPAVDVWGNVYTLGGFCCADTFGTLVFPGSTTGSDNTIVIKYNANGNLIWGYSTQDDGVSGYNIAADNYGNLYLLGTFGTTLHMGSFTLTNPSTTVAAAFLAKFTPSGAVAWAVNLGTSLGLDAEIAARNDHVYITGDFDEAVFHIGSFTCTNTNPSGSSLDVFVAKIDSNGSVIWAKSAGGFGDDFGMSIAVTPTEHVYIGLAK